MAKHPHKLRLHQKRTWRCMLPGCSFFVHLGLTHILLNKTGVCWDCGEQFVIDEYALKEEEPRCLDCRTNRPIEAVVEYNPLNPIDPSDVLDEESAKRIKFYKEIGKFK